MTALIRDEGVRAERLLTAQAQAEALFSAVTDRGVVRPGRTEDEVSDAIKALAADLVGMDRHWHKRIVRAGRNTLQPYRENPPLRTIGEDDIVFVDFGPIFQEWEADFGRTYVIGDDPFKTRLRDALPVVWEAGRKHFESNADLTGAQLYAQLEVLAAQAGWEFGGTIGGHLVGEFPHEKAVGDDLEYYIAPGSDKPLRRTDRNGLSCHWILEVHLVDRTREIGGFYEQLLDLRDGTTTD